jgi:hypothetical protein
MTSSQAEHHRDRRVQALLVEHAELMADDAELYHERTTIARLQSEHVETPLERFRIILAEVVELRSNGSSALHEQSALQEALARYCEALEQVLSTSPPVCHSTA